ncbi:MAG TPA: adenylate/guanylate cyclase domain-containing protein [Actinomycetota bacterium]|nr:adenylate/guanylate cyclase domain-containing protein [Actinomycetota bacterium]
MTDLPTGTITFLLTDIQGSTRILARLRDRYPALLEEHQRLLRQVFEAAGGFEVGTEGDSFFVVFPAAPDAVAAAASAQQALEQHEWPEGERVRVRMGLHTGEAILGGDNYTGIDLHRAARIAAAAHGGQVLLSEATHALVAQTLPEGVTMRDLGEHRLKDLPRPERLYQLQVPGLPQEFPQIRSLDTRRGNLQEPLTSFVGRREELAEIPEILAETRLLTLTGPGGSGKTRLSIQVGSGLEDAFEDGVFFVPLAAIENPELVASRIAEVLKVEEDPGRSAIEALIEHLADREMLLVLDNFEQVIPAAGTVGELIGATDGVKVLATSREPLHLVGEREYPVPPLRLPDLADLPPLEALSQYEAVELFLQRATAVEPGFAVTNENAPAVAEICSRLDGLPLAIELAAARIKLLPPDELLKRLDRTLALLSGGARDLPERQQTLRGAIAWSYDLLEAKERTLFSRLSIFMGGFSLEAADEVCSPQGELGADVLDLVASLLDKSLLRTLATGPAGTRYLMLHTIREYAREVLDDSDEAEEIGTRHAGYVLRRVEEAVPNLFGPDRARWLDALAAEHDNLRAALTWALEGGDLELGLRLGGRAWRFWQMRAHLREGREWLGRLLAHPGALDHPGPRADALEGLGGILYWMGDPQAAVVYEECLTLRRELGDLAGIGEALYNRACMHVFGIGGPQESKAGLPLLEEALEIFRELDDQIGVAKVQWVVGSAHLHDEEYEAAEAALTESVALYREAEDLFGEAWGLHMLGVTLIHEGRGDEAIPHLRRALDIFQEAGDRSAIPVLIFDFAIYANQRGERERALLMLAVAGKLQREIGVGLGEASVEFSGLLAPLLETVSDEERARAEAEAQAITEEQAVAMVRELGPA